MNHDTPNYTDRVPYIAEPPQPAPEDSMNHDILFTPKNIGSLTIKNRCVMTAMDTGMANFNGTPTNLLTDYYLQRVHGGVGLIITGICRVNNNHGVAEPRQLSLVHKRHIAKFKEMTHKIHQADGKIMVQLHHPGRQNYSALIGVWPLVELFSHVPKFESMFPWAVKALNWLENKVWSPAVVAPLAVPCQHVKQKTRALKKREIKKLVRQFVKAAERAQQAGFDGVELHAAHGYLIQQFLSPHTNRRTDTYGGSFENRLRFLQEIIDGIHSACGRDFPLVVRLTVDEFMQPWQMDQPVKAGNLHESPPAKNQSDGTHDITAPQGITLDLGIRIAKELEKLGIDALDISSGSYEQTNKWLETVTYDTGWRKYLAAEVKQAVQIPIIAANLIRSADQAATQLVSGVQDFIGLGRPLLADPEFVKKIYLGKESQVHRCIICCTCYESLVKNAWLGKPLRCAVNPCVAELPAPLTNDIGRVVVIGGGVAGMQAALTCAKRGYQVTLFEQSDQLGGQLQLADKAPNKGKLGWIIKDLTHHLQEQSVDIRLNTQVSAPSLLKELSARDTALPLCAIIVATGATPIVPNITGVQAPHVYTFDQILSGKIDPRVAISGNQAATIDYKVAVIGSGLTGLETAEYLQGQGASVLVVEMAESLAPGAHFQHKDEALEALETGGAKFLVGQRLIEIEKNYILLQSTSKPFTISREPVHAVVLALGSKPENRLANELAKALKISGQGVQAGQGAESENPVQAIAGTTQIYTIGDASSVGRIADATAHGYRVGCKV